jgi:hypothetical protein
MKLSPFAEVNQSLYVLSISVFLICLLDCRHHPIKASNFLLIILKKFRENGHGALAIDEG